MSDFDRIKRPERRLLERPDAGRFEVGEADPMGRAALFTTTSQAAAPHPDARRAGLVVECSRCGAASPLGVASALRAAFPLLVVAPCRRYPVFAVCPACRRRAWVRVGTARA